MSGIRRGRLSWTALAVVMVLSGSALAEPTGEDKAAAESLFQDALKLIKDDKYADACPKLEASAKLDPAFGTLFNLGDCYEHTGRTASAWSSFGEARRLAERLKDARAADAAEREKALEPRLAKLVVLAEKADGLVIYRDRKPIDQGLLGSAVPVDPGEHTIEAQAPGREPWSSVVHVPNQPGTVTATVPPLAAARAAQGGAGRSDAPPAGMGGQKIGAFVAGGAGVAGLIVGGIFGGLAAAKTSESNTHCDTDRPPHCDPDGLAIRKDADALATVSNVAFAAGGVLVAGGVVLYLTAPSVAPPSGPGRPGTSAARSIRLAPAVGAINGILLTGSY